MRKASVPTSKGDNEIVDAYTVEDFPYNSLSKTKVLTKHKKKTVESYFIEFGTFDIETTTIKPRSKTKAPWGFMYHWQMSVGGIFVYGRRWEEWITFIHKLQEVYGFNALDHFVIYVHNLSFEFQFIREICEEHFGGLAVFATDSRKVLRVTCGNGIEFRCSYILTNMSLAKALENEKGCKYRKAVGDLDYSKIRTADTPLTDEEFGYCIGDIATLHELIYNRLKNEHDNMESIPMTSTGYVRREARKECRKDRNYWDYFKTLKMTPDVYTLLKEAGRGGNTHANRYYSGRVWEGVDSFDVASSYPAQQKLRPFPVSAFHKYGHVTTEKFNYLINEYACLFRVIFKNISIKPEVTIPYIPVAKCLKYERGGLIDNGRILNAKLVVMTITDIDWKIIKEQYTWEQVAISDMYIAEYGMLPTPIQNVVMRYFTEKSELKCKIKDAESRGDEEALEDLNYYYNKSKNRLNAIFGMSYTDPIRAVHTINADGEWIVEQPDIQASLDKFWRSRNSFMYYAWGVWTTCWARLHLQTLLDATGSGTIYCDTDSSKAVDVDHEVINRLNEQIKKEAREKDAYVDVDGREFYLGVYEYEGRYDKFKTLGAKKYAYTQHGKFHITISGVAKKKGAQEMGSIDNFVTGFIFREAGGMTSYYNDVGKLDYINVKGCKMLSGSNIGLVNSTYELGITDEYAELIGFNIYQYE